jgi:hypothetical protein
LPLPPKSEFSNLELYGSYSKELIIVETPVNKEQYKLPIQEDEGIHMDGIVNKIIFESSEEDGMNGSSSMGSYEEDESEEVTPSSEEPQPAEEEDEEEENKIIAEEEEEEGSPSFRGEQSREHKSKKANKSRSGVKEVNPNKKVFCNCKKTKCLKLYCDCFRLNQTCEGCNCVGCHNLEVYAD